MEGHPGESKEMLTSRQKKIVLSGLVLVVLAVSPLALTGLVRHTTSNKDGCLSCHATIQGEEFWAQSRRHRPSIDCRYCHAFNDRLFDTDVSKYTDLVSFNCVQCHPNAMATNETQKVRVLIPADGKVYEWKLSDMHKWHVEKRTATCTHCHHNIAHDTTSERTYYPIIEYCAGCHYHARKDDYVRVDPLPRLIFVGKD